METNQQPTPRKSGLSKGVIGLIIGFIVLVGGGFAAYKVFWDNSAKNRYFAAEKATLESTTNFIEKRYKDELAFQEMSFENATESTIELSGSYNDPYADPMIQELVNSSKLTLVGQVDMQKQQLMTVVNADVAGVKIDNFNISLDKDHLYVATPFFDETLKISSEDLGPFLNRIDPYSFDEDMTIDFEQVFNQQNALPEDMQKHFEKEYMKLVYDELKEDYFTDAKEEVEVFGQKVKADKIELHVTEKQFQEIVRKVLEKMEKDEKLHEYLQDQLQVGSLQDQMVMEDMMDDFVEGIKMAKEHVDEIALPEGVTSVIWVYKNAIVKRELTFVAGKKSENPTAFIITGEQNLTQDEQKFNYAFNVKDDFMDETAFLDGEFNWKDNKAEDVVKFIVEDVVEIGYKGTESLSGKVRDFDREFYVHVDELMTGGSLYWVGNSEYEKDQMNAEHTFSLDIDELFDRDFASLDVFVAGKRIKAVEMPNEKDATDIGKMTPEELMETIEIKMDPELEEAIYGLMYGL